MKTKQFLVIVLSICCTASQGIAQVAFGPALGMNMANVAGDGASDNAMKIGIHAGALVDIGISRNFSIEPGALYTMKGTQSSADSKLKVHMAYLEIPFLAKYKLDNQLYFFAGPYVGFMLTGEVAYDDVSVDAKELFNNTDAGLKLGMGFETPSSLAFSLHYELGLTNVNGDEVDGYNYNNVVGITLVYWIRKK